MPFAINDANKLTDAAGATGLDRFLECLGWLAAGLALEGSRGGGGTSVLAIFRAGATVLSSVGGGADFFKKHNKQLGNG